jgi:hypothetical protein
MTKFNDKCTRCKIKIHKFEDRNESDIDEFMKNDGLCNICLTHMDHLVDREIERTRGKIRRKLIRKFKIMKCTKEIHYCKADKKSGKPVVVTDKASGNTTNVKKWKMDLFDKDGYPVRIEVEFGNSSGKAKKSGATTVLRVMENSWV